MASIINADTSDGLKITSDTSGQIDLQSAGSTKALIDTSGNLKFDSGYGSVATAYGCRAWVNFNGTGTVAIRESGNVSSITDNTTGNYTVNFATAMPDANYVPSMSVTGSTLINNVFSIVIGAASAGVPDLKTTSALKVTTGGAYAASSMTDMAEINVVIFR